MLATTGWQHHAVSSAGLLLLQAVLLVGWRWWRRPALAAAAFAGDNTAAAARAAAAAQREAPSANPLRVVPGATSCWDWLPLDVHDMIPGQKSSCYRSMESGPWQLSRRAVHRLRSAANTCKRGPLRPTLRRLICG